MRIIHGNRTTNPCPSWCQLEPGHDWDELPDDDGRTRYHVRSLSEHLDMFVQEHEGVPLSSEPVTACLVPDSDDRSAAELRALAAELLAAADELDTVTSARRGWTEDRL